MPNELGGKGSVPTPYRGAIRSKTPTRAVLLPHTAHTSTKKLHGSPSTDLPVTPAFLRHRPQHTDTYVAAHLHPSSCAPCQQYPWEMGSTGGARAVQHTSCDPIVGKGIHQPRAHSPAPDLGMAIPWLGPSPGNAIRQQSRGDRREGGRMRTAVMVMRSQAALHKRLWVSPECCGSGWRDGGVLCFSPAV